MDVWDAHGRPAGGEVVWMDGLRRCQVSENRAVQFSIVFHVCFRCICIYIYIYIGISVWRYHHIGEGEWERLGGGERENCKVCYRFS